MDAGEDFEEAVVAPVEEKNLKVAKNKKKKKKKKNTSKDVILGEFFQSI